MHYKATPTTQQKKGGGLRLSRIKMCCFNCNHLLPTSVGCFTADGLPPPHARRNHQNSGEKENRHPVCCCSGKVELARASLSCTVPTSARASPVTSSIIAHKFSLLQEPAAAQECRYTRPNTPYLFGTKRRHLKTTQRR